MQPKKTITITWGSRYGKSVFEGEYSNTSPGMPGVAVGRFDGRLPTVRLYVKLRPDAMVELSGGGLIGVQHGQWTEQRNGIQVEMR